MSSPFNCFLPIKLQLWQTCKGMFCVGPVLPTLLWPHGYIFRFPGSPALNYEEWPILFFWGVVIKWGKCLVMAPESYD